MEIDELYEKVDKNGLKLYYLEQKVDEIGMKVHKIMNMVEEIKNDKRILHGQRS